MTTARKWTPPARIRAVAIGIVLHQNRLLVFEGYDELRQSAYYRPLGGEIEFGETGEQALQREFMEEIGQPIAHIRYLETLENHYTLDGIQGHELVRVYTAELTDADALTRDYTICEPGQPPLKTRWLDLDAAAENSERLVPQGIWDLLSRLQK